MQFLTISLSISLILLSSVLAISTYLSAQPTADDANMTFYSALFIVVLLIALLFSFNRSERPSTSSLSLNLFRKKQTVQDDEHTITSEKILNTVSSCVIACDLEKRIVYINDNARKLINQADDENPIQETIVNILDLRDSQEHLITDQVINEQINNPERPFNVGQVLLFGIKNNKRYVTLRTNAIFAKDKTIEGVVLSLRDVTADRKIMTQLYRQASRDALTGLINRGSFEQFLEQIILSSVNDKLGHILAYIDLDHFKIINDTCGHAAGDELLRQVSDIFQNHIRQIDRVARVGGDEFAILLQGCPLDRSIEIVNNILQELRSFRFIWQERNFMIGASIGVVEFNSGVGKSLKALLNAADKACYMAKKLGRDQYFVLNLNQAATNDNLHLLEWGKYLKKALANDDFALFAQPVVSLQTEHLDGIKQYEVFVRLPHDKNTFTPGSFMPEAERLGLTEQIDQWVIQKCISVLSDDDHSANTTHEISMMTECRLMINLSSQSVQNDDFADFIEESIANANLSPALFCFEVSEPTAVANFAKTKRLFTKLRKFGCACSLDDFGSGFSSLSYLRELPVNYLKIDGGFVQNLASNDIDAEMVRAVNQVGRVMNLYSIAEAVENEQTLRALQEIGIDFAQGYYCGKPVPFYQFAKSIEKADSNPTIDMDDLEDIVDISPKQAVVAA